MIGKFSSTVTGRLRSPTKITASFGPGSSSLTSNRESSKNGSLTSQVRANKANANSRNTFGATYSSWSKRNFGNKSPPKTL
jgi:hypothetical protein